MKTRLVIVAFLSLALVLSAFGRTTKSTYPDPCSEVWSAVNDTLGNPDNYSVDQSDERELTAPYHPKHTVAAKIATLATVSQLT